MGENSGLVNFLVETTENKVSGYLCNVGVGVRL